jgi:hypothetical protein
LPLPEKILGESKIVRGKVWALPLTHSWSTYLRPKQYGVQVSPRLIYDKLDTFYWQVYFRSPGRGGVFAGAAFAAGAAVGLDKAGLDTAGLGVGLGLGFSNVTSSPSLL